jgi:tetratricopeptide (TPR) repeat protein
MVAAEQIISRYHMPQFIGREDWLQRFKDYLQQQQGVIWRITGQPGIGKSTLLREFEYFCEAAQRPNIWLDLESFTPAQGLEVLAAMASAARFFDTEKANKGWKEKVGEGFTTGSGFLLGALELGKSLIPGGELIAGGAKVLVDLGAGVAGSAAQTSENAAAAHPELYLLEALAKAGEKHPVLLVDTYEHILRHDLKVQSRLVLGYGQAREGSVKTLRLSEWLHELFEYLQTKGWRMVMAGREVPRSKPDDQLPRFSRDEILQAARIRPALAEYLPTQESAIASVLSTLSFDGNPLWLQVAMNLLENLLAEGKDFAQLAQQPDHLHACFETDDPFDTGAYDGIEHGRCKLTLINTLTRHIGDLEDQAWKIALPRVLDKGIVMQLFAPQQANAILHNFKLAGVFRVAGQQFTLHEEIRDLLLAYARSKGWLDSDETRALHGKLWDYLNQTYGKDLDSYPLVWMAEACYQRIMSGVGLLDKQIDPKTFWWELGGATDLSLPEKWLTASELPDLTKDEIEQLRENLVEEKQWLYQMLGAETVDKLHKDLSDAVVASPWELGYWQQRVIDYGLVGDYFVLQYVQQNPAERIQIIDKMLEIHGDSTIPDVEKRCAMALLNKGVTLGKKLDDPQGEAALYDYLLYRYGDSTVPDVQEQCATALFNKGVMLGEKLNDPQSAVVVYDYLLYRYGDSTVPDVQERCVMALLNKGVTLGKKLDDPQGEVAVYDDLLYRYGDSTVPIVQEHCATALTYKGVMLREKLDDLQGEVAVYDDLIYRYGDSTVPSVQEQCATALTYKGVMLREKLDDPQGEVAVYDDLLYRYGDSTVPSVQEKCCMALVNKGWTLTNKLNNPEGAVTVYDDLLHRYGNSTVPRVRERCIRVLACKIFILNEKFNDPQSALSVYEDLLHYYDDSSVPSVQEQCATMLVYKAVMLNEKLNDPQGAVAVYGDLLHYYGDSTVPSVQERCATALVYHGMVLREKLNDPQGAVAVYDNLLRHYGDSTVSGVQRWCTMALSCKAETLTGLDDLAGAIVCYDDLLVRYSQSENPAVQEQCQSALANMIEPLLVWGRNVEAIQCIQQVLARTDATNQEFAIMHFLLWLAEDDTTLDDVLAAIRALSPDVEFAWGWDEIRPLVDKLPEPRKTQAECFIAFFEQHHDLAQLESCLANTPEDN